MQKMTVRCQGVGNNKQRQGGDGSGRGIKTSEPATARPPCDHCTGNQKRRPVAFESYGTKATGRM